MSQIQMKSSKSSVFRRVSPPKNVPKIKKSRSERNLSNLLVGPNEFEFKRGTKGRQSLDNIYSAPNKTIVCPKMSNQISYLIDLRKNGKSSPFLKLKKKIQQKFGLKKNKNKIPAKLVRKVSDKSIVFWEEDLTIPRKK